MIITARVRERFSGPNRFPLARYSGRGRGVRVFNARYGWPSPQPARGQSPDPLASPRLLGEGEENLPPIQSHTLRASSLGSLLASTLIACFAASCTVGPNYSNPPTTVPSQYADTSRPVPASADTRSTTQPSTAPTTRASKVTTAAQPVAEWWTTLNEPELNRLIERAVAGNLTLQQAASRVRESRAELRKAGGKELPSVDGAAAYAHVDAGKNVTLGKGAPPLVTDIWQLGFDTKWEIDLFGGQRRMIEAAAADLQASIEQNHDSLVSLTAEVARDYLQLRGVQERLRIARENLALQHDTLDLTQSLRKAGFSSELDLSRQRTQVSQTLAQIVPLMTQARQQEHALAILLGQEPGALVGELDSAAPLPETPAVVAIGLPADLLRRRPDIRRAERQIAAANARVGAAISDFYPKFSLTGDFGLDSNQFKSLFDLQSRYFIIYPSIDWRLFDFGQTARQVDIQKEQHRQALLGYENTLLTGLREVEDALIAYADEQDHRAALADAVSSARESVEIARDQYKQGIIDFLQVLDAQRQLLSAQDGLAQSQQANSTNLVALYKALGGGWETRTEQAGR